MLRKLYLSNIEENTFSESDDKRILGIFTSAERLLTTLTLDWMQDNAFLLAGRMKSS